MKKVDAAELTAGGGGGGVAIASGDTNNYVMTSDGTGDCVIVEAGFLLNFVINRSSLHKAHVLRVIDCRNASFFAFIVSLRF